MRLFYDGKKRPAEASYEWTEAEFDRVCLNCNHKFRLHMGYICPYDEPEE